MRFTSIIAIIPATLPIIVSAVTGKLGDAPIEKNSPSNVTYRAQLVQNTAFQADTNGPGPTSGEVIATAAKDGSGVVFNVQFKNLPRSGGPFMYHLHVNPVQNGNCTTALAHLDPYIRGEDPICDSHAPQSCQVGDLSGKFGEIKAENIHHDSWSTSFTDPYSTLQTGVGSFFGNRSVVLHFANKTRIACGNFMHSSENNTTGEPSSPSASGDSKKGAAGLSLHTGSGLAAVAAVVVVILAAV